MQVPDWVDRPDLKFRPLFPATPTALTRRPGPFLPAIRKGDILLHHPFQSVQAGHQAFIQQAATDPHVVAIKQDCVSHRPNSELMQTLIDAAGSGKEVTVVVELMGAFRRGGQHQAGRRGWRRSAHTSLIYCVGVTNEPTPKHACGAPTPPCPRGQLMLASSSKTRHQLHHHGDLLGRCPPRR